MSSAQPARATSLYFIQSLDNGGVYVGVTVAPRGRWSNHKYDHKRRNTPLYQSMRKYSVSRHIFSIVETHLSFEVALEAEVWWIAYLRAIGARVFNLTDGGEGALGYKFTPEALAKLSASHIGKTWGPEQRAKMQKAMKGRVFTPEWKAKLAQANKGRKPSPEAVAKTAQANRGRHHSLEARAKISAAQRNRVFSDSHRANLSASATGRTHTPETKAKLAEQRRGCVHSPEIREKISAVTRAAFEARPEAIHRGEKKAHAKLTDDQVREIRQLLAHGESHRAIARIYGVSHTVIGYLAIGRTWSHVT